MILLAFQQVSLVPDGTIFIHIALILIMIWVLNRTLFRPVNRIIASRESQTGGRSNEAQEILRSVSEKQAHYEEAMRQARGEGYELVENERANAIAEKQSKVAATKEETEQLFVRQTDELNSQTVAARGAIAADAAKLAERIAANILK